MTPITRRKKPFDIRTAEAAVKAGDMIRLREAQVNAIRESRHTSAAWRERGRRPWEVH